MFLFLTLSRRVCFRLVCFARNGISYFSLPCHLSVYLRNLNVKFGRDIFSIQAFRTCFITALVGSALQAGHSTCGTAIVWNVLAAMVLAQCASQAWRRNRLAHCALRRKKRRRFRLRSRRRKRRKSRLRRKPLSALTSFRISENSRKMTKTSFAFHLTSTFVCSIGFESFCRAC